MTAPAVPGPFGGFASTATMRLAADLSEALVRPLSILHPSGIQLGPLPGEALARASAAPAFAGPINRAVSRHLGWDALALDADFLLRLAGRPRSRLSVLLITRGLDAIETAALHVAAAVSHRAIVSVVLGAERARLRAALGESAFEVATREALLLHAPLVGPEVPPGAGPLADRSDERRLREALVRQGLDVLRRVLEIAEPALAVLFPRRFPARWIDRDGASRLPFGEEGCDHVVRLLRRRVPAWAASIA